MESPTRAHQIPGRRSTWITGGYRVCGSRIVGRGEPCAVRAGLGAAICAWSMLGLAQGSRLSGPVGCSGISCSPRECVASGECRRERP